MSFPRYPKYKASGVEWLGDVPEHWEVKPLRSVFKFSKGLTITKEDLQDDGVYCVNYGEIHSKYGFLLNPTIHPLRCVPPEYLGSNPDALIGDGDFVFADTSEDLEGSGNFTHLRYDRQLFAGYHTIIARPKKNICSLLLAYEMHSLIFRSQIQSQVKGVKVFSISQGLLKSVKCLLPPLPEQTAIAEFLDRETAKIDDLVAEQRRLKELLKEKRQAVISHAVTKGLNPHVDMKPSGIEWLGDVPVGWRVLPLKRIVAVPITDGPHETPQFVDYGVPFVSAEAVSSGQIDFSKVRACISLEDNARYSKKYSPKMHDIYMVKSGATTGVTAIVEHRTDFNIWSPLAVIRCNSGSLPHFVLNFMRSRHFLEAVTLFWSFGTQQNIGMGVIENLACTVPPLDEQLAITRFLEAELAKFDTLTAEAQRAIDLLQERRTALISAAVIGQIDVRQQTRN